MRQWPYTSYSPRLSEYFLSAWVKICTWMEGPGVWNLQGQNQGMAWSNTVVGQSLSHVRLFVAPWTAAHQFPLSSTIPGVCSDSCPLYRWCYLTISSSATPFCFAFDLAQHQSLFLWLALPIRWPKYWSFSISPSSEYSGLISFRIDWLDLLEIQGILKSLLQNNSKASIHQCSAFFMVQLSHLYLTTGKT